MSELFFYWQLLLRLLMLSQIIFGSCFSCTSSSCGFLSWLFYRWQRTCMDCRFNRDLTIVGVNNISFYFCQSSCCFFDAFRGVYQINYVFIILTPLTNISGKRALNDLDLSIHRLFIPLLLWLTLRLLVYRRGTNPKLAVATLIQ